MTVSYPCLTILFIEEKIYFQHIYNKFYEKDEFLEKLNLGALSDKEKILPGDLACQEAKDPLKTEFIEPDFNKVKNYIDNERHIKA